MYIHTFTFIIPLAIAAFAADEKLVDYYVNLITNETEKARNYQLPEDASEFKPNNSELKDFGSYDFIIVGSGSAGSVVARRLSENKNWNILVLEAGTYENDFVDIPAMCSFAQQSQYNWNFITVPQKNACLGLINQQCPHPRGKGLGGSSLLNYLVYSRGNKADFDKWAAEGNPGWDYETVLKYFKKSENVNISNAEAGYHGKGGPLNVEYSQGYSRHFYDFIDANKELGRDVLDYNGRNELGVSKIQSNTLHGTRWSSSRAFLYPVLNRRNLKVSTRSYVTKILVDKNNRAHGVVFVSNGTTYQATASKEIVLSGGSFGSAQLLMLSGIGPKGHLSSHKIPVIEDLPVGRTLEDHTMFYGLNILSNNSAPVRSLRENVKNYLRNVGPFTFSFNAQGLGFYQTNLTNRSEYPDIEILIVPPNSGDSIDQKNIHFTDETAKVLQSVAGTFTLYIVLMHPASKGTLELKSDDPFDYPLIDPRYLSDPNGKDIETIYQGIQLAVQMLDTKSFAKINARLAKVIHPKCKSLKYLSKDFWYCTIRCLSAHLFHPIATCKMGPRSTQSVVDARLKVYGIKSLRVADASIIPFALSGHPNAVAMMIGERVSDFIKQDY